MPHSVYNPANFHHRMSIGPGARVGQYEIVAAIGSGGMGEVYRAADTVLGRQVAIKVLPVAVATDPERLARFQREAKTLALLNHPHIAQIYGFECSGTTPALVMELVEGETLADRIARGPLPIDDALTIAKQIAEALEAAHGQGIIHRDLKPANIKITPGGDVKVLDFGLAKLADASVAGLDAHAVSLSPTITSPAMTGVGVLLGTAAYMAPEQVKGKPADKRSDIWAAFGCVLYEMLAAKRAFDGDDAAETLAYIMARDADWTRLPPNVPLPIATLIRRCLERNQRKRVGDIAVALYVIEESGGRVGTRDGRELFFRSGDQMMVVEVGQEPASRPKPLFAAAFERGDIYANYDVSPDGAHFIVVNPGEEERRATDISVLLNWTEALKEKIPAGRQ